jgi:uncharacterized protein YcbX
MALIATSVTDIGLSLTAPGMPLLDVPSMGPGPVIDVTVWKFTGRGIDAGNAAANWVSSFLQTELRLVGFDCNTPRQCDPQWTSGVRATTKFPDGFPILVISRASLADLNSRLSAALPMERFRPNIVIDDVAAYDEDRMHELRAGPVTLRMVKACTRCAITTTEQNTGERDGTEPLDTLKGYRFDAALRGVVFGQNAIVVDGAGEQLRVGQSFDISWKP